MGNIAKAGPNVIKAHLEHLKEHGQQDLVDEAIDFLKESNIEIPDYEALPLVGGCPGSMTRDLRRSGNQTHEPVTLTSELGNWPIQLQLLNPNAPYLKNAELLLAADCAPFVYVNFHQRFLKDKVLIILCPKLDKKAIFIVHMEVPCCSGIEIIVQRALEKAQKNIIIKDYTISINGEIMSVSYTHLTLPTNREV